MALNSLASGNGPELFGVRMVWGFSEQKRLNARGFPQEFLRSSMLYRPGKSLKRRASLL